PHVTEVSEVRQTHAAVSEDARDLTNVELRRCGRERPVADEEQNDRSARRGERRDEQNVRAPLGAPDGVHEIRRSLPQSQRTYEHAQSRPAPAPEPRRHYLHSGRIDSGEEQPREKSQAHAHAETFGEETESRVDDCARSGRGGEEATSA